MASTHLVTGFRCIFQAVDKDIKEEVKEAVAIAEKDIELPLDELYNDIYMNPEPDFQVRGSDSQLYPSK